MIGESIAYFAGSDQYPSGFATVVSISIQPEVAYGYVERIVQVGSNYRLYLSGVKGTFVPYAQLISVTTDRALLQLRKL